MLNSTLLWCLAAVFCAAASSVTAQECKILQTRVFPGGNEKVLLARRADLGPAANLGLFKAPLAVNTDGAPNSYHPSDFLGETKAINRIDNGITIRKAAKPKVALPVSEKLAVFNSWVQSGTWNEPSGYNISWKNVIAADAAGLPCVFKQQDAGYFGSLTALKNGLPLSQAGECQRANQLDQRFVPAIVLRGNSNPLKNFGARVGDLLIAINPTSGVAVPAIVGDSGDGNRIGEGSVALNMALLGKTVQPANYQQAKQLDTGTQDIIVAVIPGSRSFALQRPHTSETISGRAKSWASGQGYGSMAEFTAAIRACAANL